MLEKFDSGIAELLEVDSIENDQVLEDFESWDSLTSLSIIAFIDENYNISLTRKDLTDAKTIGGLKEIILSKQNDK